MMPKIKKIYRHVARRIRTSRRGAGFLNVFRSGSMASGYRVGKGVARLFAAFGKPPKKSKSRAPTELVPEDFSHLFGVMRTLALS
jgi:hypothetical protein